MDCDCRSAPAGQAASGIAAFALATVSLLHFVWATGKSWPLKEASDLTGLPADQSPGPAASSAVGGVLAFAAALAAGWMQRTIFGRVARSFVALVLTVRGIAGVSGQTSRLVGWSTSDRFRALDRRFYGPFCLTVALLLVISRRSRPARATDLDQV